MRNNTDLLATSWYLEMGDMKEKKIPTLALKTGTHLVVTKSRRKKGRWIGSDKGSRCEYSSAGQDSYSIQTLKYGLSVFC